MRTFSLQDAQKQFPQILESGETVEVKHAEQSFMIIPKEELRKLEDELLIRDAEFNLATSKKRYKTKDVEKMLEEISKG